jgi:hypothetical protein
MSRGGDNRQYPPVHFREKSAQIAGAEGTAETSRQRTLNNPPLNAASPPNQKSEIRQSEIQTACFPAHFRHHFPSLSRRVREFSFAE